MFYEGRQSANYAPSLGGRAISSDRARSKSTPERLWDGALLFRTINQSITTKTQLEVLRITDYDLPMAGLPWPTQVSINLLKRCFEVSVVNLGVRKQGKK